MDQQHLTIGVGLIVAGVVLVATATGAMSTITADRSVTIPVSETDDTAYLSVDTESSSSADPLVVSSGQPRTIQTITNTLPTSIQISSYEVSVGSAEDAVSVTETPEGATLSQGETSELRIDCVETDRDVELQLSQIEAEGDGITISSRETYDVYVRCENV